MLNSKSDAYAAAGVDITAGYKAVELMKTHIARTVTDGVLSGIGGFGGLFELDLEGISKPVLVSGTDGVVKFGNLPAGLYMVWNSKPVNGYQTIDPFLVTVPVQIKDEKGKVIESTEEELAYYANLARIYPNYASLRCKDTHKVIFRLWGKSQNGTVIIELQKSVLNAYKIDLNDEFYSQYKVRDKKYGHIIVDSIQDASDVILHFMKIVDSEYYKALESTTTKAVKRKTRKTKTA